LPTKELPALSLFASRDDANSKLVLVAINKDPTFAVTAQIQLPACGEVTGQRTFEYGAHTPKLVAGAAAVVSPTGITHTIPPFSVAVVELTLAAQPK
jgi:hypothetical protein